MRASNVIFCLGAAILAVGCSKTEDSQMSGTDQANFKGGKGTAMTDAQKKAMGDFQSEFKRKHPTSGGPGAPPPGAGAPPSEASSSAAPTTTG